MSWFRAPKLIIASIVFSLPYVFNILESRCDFDNSGSVQTHEHNSHHLEHNHWTAEQLKCIILRYKQSRCQDYNVDYYGFLRQEWWICQDKGSSGHCTDSKYTSVLENQKIHNSCFTKNRISQHREDENTFRFRQKYSPWNFPQPPGVCETVKNYAFFLQGLFGTKNWKK